MSSDIPPRHNAPKPSSERVPGLYMQVAARFSQKLDNDLWSHSDVKAPFVGVLSMIHQEPGIRQGQCADNLGYDATTFGRYIDRMVRDGLIERTVPEHDRRAVTLQLSEKGMQVFDNCRPILASLESDVRQRMGDADWDQLTELLERFLLAYDHPLPRQVRRDLAAE